MGSTIPIAYSVDHCDQSLRLIYANNFKAIESFALSSSFIFCNGEIKKLWKLGLKVKARFLLCKNVKALEIVFQKVYQMNQRKVND